MKPEISIIIPTYNAELFIARALESCIRQTFSYIEIIIVDDCGKDKSIEIAQEYAKKDKRIKIVYNEKNLGTLRARYEGVIVAQGKYIMFLDPDDVLEQNACEEVHNAFLQDENIDMILFNHLICNNQNKSVAHNLKYEKNILTRDEFLFFWLKDQKARASIINNVWNKAFKKYLYIESFKQPTLNLEQRVILPEDILFVTTYLALPKNISIINKSIYIYMYNSDSISNTQDIAKIQSNIKDIKYVLDCLAPLGNNSSLYNICVKIIMCNLTAHLKDIEKSNTTNIIKQVSIEIQKKITKMKKSFLIQRGKSLYIEKR